MRCKWKTWKCPTIKTYGSYWQRVATLHCANKSKQVKISALHGVVSVVPARLTDSFALYIIYIVVNCCSVVTRFIVSLLKWASDLCLAFSAFIPSNEMLNVWTHLLPCVLMLWRAYHTYTTLSEPTDIVYWPLWINFFGEKFWTSAKCEEVQLFTHPGVTVHTDLCSGLIFPKLLRLVLGTELETNVRSGWARIVIQDFSWVRRVTSSAKTYTLAKLKGLLFIQFWHARTYQMRNLPLFHSTNPFLCKFCLCGKKSFTFRKHNIVRKSCFIANKVIFFKPTLSVLNHTGAIYMFLASSCAHLFSCRSPFAQEFCFCVDYSAISCYGLTTFIANLLYVYPLRCFIHRSKFLLLDVVVVFFCMTCTWPSWLSRTSHHNDQTKNMSFRSMRQNRAM